LEELEYDASYDVSYTVTGYRGSLLWKGNFIIYFIIYIIIIKSKVVSVRTTIIFNEAFKT
jgi:hypothetical protein